MDDSKSILFDHQGKVEPAMSNLVKHLNSDGPESLNYENQQKEDLIRTNQLLW